MKPTRTDVFTSVANFALKNHLPLDAAAVYAAEMLKDNKLNKSSDTMDVLMSEIQKAAHGQKKSRRGGKT